MKDKYNDLLKIDCNLKPDGQMEFRIAMGIGQNDEEFQASIGLKLQLVINELGRQLVKDYINHTKKAKREEKREGVLVDFMSSLEKLKTNDIIK